MVIKNKRKKVDVKINKVKKPFEGAIEIDLKSAIEPEEAPSAPVAGGRDKKRKSFFSSSKSPKPPLSSGPKEKKSPQPPFAKEGNDGKSPKPSNARGGQSGLQLNIYRKIAYSFVILTLALLAVIFYISFVKVTIVVAPAREKISNNLIIDIYDKTKHNALKPGAVFGIVERVNSDKTKIYYATGSTIVGEETAGKVVIINNYAKNQPLVATTRLLSSDNKLFRLKNTVNVPAGGTVEVEVYADKPGRDMEIGPDKFTIPGLWAGLQDKIYAESEEPMRYRQNAKKSITRSDIDSAIRNLRKELIADIESKISEKYKNYNQIAYRIDENSININIGGKAGEEKEEFSVSMAADIEVAAFNDGAIKKMARDKLVSIIASGKKLKEFKENNMTYALDSHNASQGIAVVNVFFEGETALTSEADLIDTKKILGLTREQLDDFLTNEPRIQDYEIKFSPSFIDKAPNSANRINIKIKD